MLIPKIGCVAAHPANVHRLLYDEQQLVLVFPEGRKGTEKLYKDRYRLRRFGRGGFVEAAMRARAPIVPVCVVGAEEAAPVFAQVGPAQAADRAPLLPDHARRSRTSGLLGMLGYLPAKFKIRFLEPIHFDEQGMHEDKALVQTVAHEVRARIQENLLEMVAHAQVGLVRMTMDSQARSSSPACRPTGAAGSRRRSRRPEIEAIIGVDNEEPAGRARAHRVREGRRPARAAAADRRGRRDRHGRRHAARRRLDHHDARARRTRTTSSGR